MFSWWTRRRRRRILAEAEPADLRVWLREGIWQWRYMPADMADRAIQWLRVFEREKFWEGCGGFQLEPHHRWIVAGQASLMALAFPEWHFNGCRTLLIYPSDYVAPGITHMVDSQIGIHGEQPRSGQTSYRGPVILNWPAIERAGRSDNEGQSITVHELAHQLDFDNGPGADGLPPLPAEIDATHWHRTFQDQLEELRDYVRRGYDVLVDDYGLSSASELFAVGSELFFQQPHELGYFHAELFGLLLDCYRNDWRQWLPQPE